MKYKNEGWKPLASWKWLGSKSGKVRFNFWIEPNPINGIPFWCACMTWKAMHVSTHTLHGLN